jgi:hypothetical protein
MKPFRLFQPGQNPWSNGLRLALLNATLAAFSVISFMGVLYTISWINQLRFAKGASPSSELPFPYLVLMLLYAILFLVVWIWFGRRLHGIWQERIITVLIGSAPLFVLSVLGYAGVIGAVVFNEMNPDTVPAGSVFVFGGISTLILFAGVTCVGLISLASRAADNPSPAAPISAVEN